MHIQNLYLKLKLLKLGDMLKLNEVTPTQAPNTKSVQCNICTKTIRRKQRNITCIECKMKYHKHCMGIDRNETQWTCNMCILPYMGT